MTDIADTTANVSESRRQGFIGQYRWLSFCQEEDCSSETAQKARGNENVCMLLGSGYPKE